MSLNTHTWESRLLTLAYEALPTATPTSPETTFDKSMRIRAYAYCKALTAKHSRSFYLASFFLPEEKRQAVWALYAFCRISDDIVDEATSDSYKALAAWRRRILSAKAARNDLVALAWVDTKARYQIPHRYAEQLIEGVGRDFHQTRYETFSDLATYAYGVASTVGLMTMHIIGFAGPGAIAYAVKLGVALQMTNILRDVGEDWRAGRLYLPAEELAAFGLSEADMAAGQVDNRWRAFMRLQITRNRQLYAEAWPGINLLDPDGRLAIAVAARLYEAILADIELHDYDVFNRRAHLGTWDKLKMLPQIWWQSRQVS
jgi:15-cis-phytoene synthase